MGRDSVQLGFEGWWRSLIVLVFFHHQLGHKKGAFACKIYFPIWESEMWRLGRSRKLLSGPLGLSARARGQSMGSLHTRG